MIINVEFLELTTQNGNDFLLVCFQNVFHPFFHTLSSFRFQSACNFENLECV